MDKIKVFFIHVLLSACVISLFLVIIYFIWYPKPFFDISGVIEPIKLLVIVDVIIGPLLTLIVYKKGKKTLVMDLTVIALLQIAALGYGAYTINSGRPVMIAFTGGKFHYLAEKYAHNDELKYTELKSSLFSRPKYGYLSQMEGLDIYTSYKDIEPVKEFNLTMNPYSLSADDMKSKFNSQAARIDGLLQQYGDQDIVFFLLEKELSGYYVLYSKTQDEIIDYLIL